MMSSKQTTLSDFEKPPEEASHLRTGIATSIKEAIEIAESRRHLYEKRTREAWGKIPSHRRAEIRDTVKLYRDLEFAAREWEGELYGINTEYRRARNPDKKKRLDKDRNEKEATLSIIRRYASAMGKPLREEVGQYGVEYWDLYLSEKTRVHLGASLYTHRYITFSAREIRSLLHFLDGKRKEEGDVAA